MTIYCYKCHCLLQFVDKKDVKIAFEYICECPNCKYKIVVWKKK